MEILSSRYLSGSLKSSQRRIFRSRYVRLNGHRKKMKTARLGGGSPVRAWKIRASARRVKIVLSSPVRLLRKLKNFYFSMLLKLAGEHGHQKRITRARHLPIAKSTADFNNRLLMEIYKSFVVSREMSTS
ncbi:hypothetical protein POM88_050731 [Heracleum sosnowskyi]|uniref:Uncharacterized protein n=1 Tax=Heracleum sosnowskyi TaxID=360622 RepID=A0AAD8H0Q0_9APIA|nr:hypothetical protein POM88_050731 [Heracleum sosnowskyi]